MSFIRRVIYGEEHPYAVPMSGLGSRDTISTLTRDDLIDWHRRWFQPTRSTIAVTGAVSMDLLLPQLELMLGKWKASSAEAEKTVPVPRPVRPSIYLIDQPGAPQSVIVGAHVSERGGTAEDIAIATVMKGFGGGASSRLNLNLRVDKQWSYNAWATVQPGRGPRTFLLFAPVQTDKTKESLIEIGKELRAIAGERPITGEELASVLRMESLNLPGRFATLSSLEDAAIDMVSFGYPADYYREYATKVRSLTSSDLDAAARRYIHPEKMIWIIRGDLAKIEQGIRDLKLGEIIRVDHRGQPLG